MFLQHFNRKFSHSGNFQVDRAADIHRENQRKKRRELEQVNMDASSDLLDTDSNATIAMVCSLFYANYATY